MAKKQLYWEEVSEGMDVTALPKIATSQMLVRWAGASGDFVPIHYDNVFAASQGLPDIIVHGALKAGWLGHMLTDWIGEEGFLKKMGCQYRGMDIPRRMRNLTEPTDGETWWCKGKVTKKYVQDSEHLVDCEIWVENSKGEKTTPGVATVRLPARQK